MGVAGPLSSVHRAGRFNVASKHAPSRPLTSRIKQQAHAMRNGLIRRTNTGSSRPAALWIVRGDRRHSPGRVSTPALPVYDSVWCPATGGLSFAFPLSAYIWAHQGDVLGTTTYMYV